jgi:hypothetical protein
MSTPTLNTTSNQVTTNDNKTNIFAHVLLFIFGLLFLTIGISTIRYYNAYDTQASAKVLESQCDNFRTKSGLSYSCNLKLEYFVKELQTNKTQIVSTSNVIYSTGEMISIRYNSRNSSQIILESDSNKLTGFIFAGIGGFIMIILLLILLGFVSPIKTSSIVTTNYRDYNYGNRPYQTYLTPEQTFASTLGMSLGSKIANKI